LKDRMQNFTSRKPLNCLFDRFVIRHIFLCCVERGALRAAYGGSKKKQLLFRKLELIINECAIELTAGLARSRGARLICKITFAIRATNQSYGTDCVCLLSLVPDCF